MSGQTVYLVDASIYVFRAWFSVSDTVTGADGQPVNAVYGFCDFVMRLLREKNPQRIVFVFDESLESSFRNEIYPLYKANREPAPEELKAQFRYCRELVSALGIGEIADKFYEADDLIGSLSVREKACGRAIVLVSGDKDLTQLVRRGDYWWNYAKRVSLDYAGIHQNFGVYPEQIADMLAITGDAVDNIPGVPGIGPVTAVQLLNHFGSFDNLFNNLSDVGKAGVRGAKRVEASLREYSETARLARRLTEIYCDVELPDDLETTIAPADPGRLESLLQQLAFSQWRTQRWMEFAGTLAVAK